MTKKVLAANIVVIILIFIGALVMLKAPKVLENNASVVINPIKDIPKTDNLIVSTTTAQGITFMYPKELPITYITPQDWPPIVELKAGKFTCAKTGVELHTVGNRLYCVTKSSEGAAGSTYTTYQYSTTYGDFVARISFTLRFPQCMNYDNPEQDQCKREQVNFDIDSLADRVASSITKR